MKKGDTDKVEVNKKKVILNLNWKYQDEPKIFFFLAKKKPRKSRVSTLGISNICIMLSKYHVLTWRSG